MSIGARSQSAKTYLEKHYESFADCEYLQLFFFLFLCEVSSDYFATVYLIL